MGSWRDGFGESDAEKTGAGEYFAACQLVVALTLYESEVAKGYLTQYNDDAGGALSEEAVGRTET